MANEVYCSEIFLAFLDHLSNPEVVEYARTGAEQTCRESVATGMRAWCGRLDGEAATDYTTKCVEICDRHLRSLAGRHCSVRWLCLLRGAPWGFIDSESELRWPATLMIAETATGASSRRPSEDRANPLAPESLNDVIDLVATARLFLQLMTARKMATKGVSIVASEGWPAAQKTQAEEDSLVLIDERLKQEPVLFPGVGTEVATLRKGEPDDTTVLAIRRTREPRQFVPSDETGAIGAVWSQFASSWLSLDGIAGLRNALGELGDSWFHPEVVPLAALLASLPGSMLTIQEFYGQLLPHGFLEMTTDRFRGLLRKAWPRASALISRVFGRVGSDCTQQAVIQSLHSMHGRTLPLYPGPIVRPTEQGYLIDIATATQLLVRRLQFPRADGSLGQRRGPHFEQSVRTVVERSKSPARGMAPLIGRTLAIDKQELTDIDALAETDRDILIVSCKSVLWSPELEAGDFRLSRNLRTDVETAVAQADAHTTVLRSRRKGDNYDFGLGRQITIVVCTPFPVWVPIGAATRELLPGLRACVSLTELRKWLG
jgi:hypothetical protein